MKHFLTAFLLAFSAAAAAQDLPALYSVTGVAADDVLNIRAAPSASAAMRGSYAPGEAGIEVTARDETGRWGRVNLGESAGWVSMRYLQITEPGPDVQLARRLHCSGTEPFWSLEIEQGRRAVFRTPDGAQQLHPGTGRLVPARGRPDRFAIGLGGGAAAVIRRAECKDGMSDQAYGLGIDLLMTDAGLTLYSGCCSLQP